MNASLRILQITNRIPFPLNDGGTIATYNVTYYLNASGHKVTLASLNTNKHHQDPAVLKDIASVYTTDIDTTVTAAGLLRGIFSDLPYNIKRFDSPAFKNLLTHIVSNNTFDIIQIEGSYMALYISVLRKHSNASIVLRSHNIEHEIWERMALHESNRLKSWYFGMLSKKIKRFEDSTMHAFDAVVAITDRDADYYRRHHFKGTLEVINAGADLSKWIPDHTHIEKNTICFLAGLDWMPNQQGLDWFLNQIWPELKKRFPPLQLHIAGKAMPPHYLQLNDPS
ncbi:MAG: glycosyltransferase, partial [Cytophagales bacterium]|nr:glycosyltransferase [Cytophaga sp.]